jgi:clan AA aspartic protease
MRIAQVTVAVCNPADTERRWERVFVIDTEALDCVVPANRLREIGIEPTRERIYERADGSTVTLPVGCAHFEFMGEFVPANVIFGADDADPVLGMLALQSVGIEFDRTSNRLKRRPAVRFKMIG